MYYQTDALGNVMDVTDHIGDTVMKYRYDAFGNLFTQMAAPYNTTGYTVKTYDAKACLVDYSARWYSPSTGRFTSEDTFLGWIEEPLSLNRYSYVHNNPVNYIDPTGHWQEGDENLPEEDQERIRDLTNQWYNATSQEERDRIHQEAEDIRNGNSGGSRVVLEVAVEVRVVALEVVVGQQHKNKCFKGIIPLLVEQEIYLN